MKDRTLDLPSQGWLGGAPPGGKQGRPIIEPAGYDHPAYAHSLREFGQPVELPKAGGWFLRRDIPGWPEQDGMGCYPIFACRDWPRLEEDMAELGDGLISFSAVLDPFGHYETPRLERCFPDVVAHFKDHYVTDLHRPPKEIASKHHRYYAQKAMRKVDVEICGEPSRFLEEWSVLYGTLTQKHAIGGIRAFSRDAFAGQLTVPGLVMFLGRHKGEVIAAQLWYVQRDVGYSHLAACSQTGYVLSASYALHWAAIEYFSGKVRWMDLGGGSGTTDDSGGLTQFKRGWATGTRPVYFCGRIFEPRKYAQIAQANCLAPTRYFPAYREGEFA
jgi:GNAT acetyltransferase-like protein